MSSGRMKLEASAAIVQACEYRPLLDREAQTAERMNHVLRQGGNVSTCLARFIDKMTAKERSTLRRLVR